MATEGTLSVRVAEEIRAMLGRKRITGRELARRLGVSQPWVSYRLTGHQEIGLDDLDRIARALDVPLTDLLPATVRPNNRSAALTVRPMLARRRDVSRPKGRPSAESTRPVSAVPANKRRPQPVGSPSQSMAA